MQYAQQIIEEVRKAVVGKDNVLTWVLAAILARGHILLEDIPGVGKTTMALAFSKVLGLQYGRIQLTPDVLPSDITGYSIYDKESGRMTYQPGAAQCNLLLADELNRATSRTQSALLEAMEEGQVTVDGVSHSLPTPFTVLATQNPTGASGTQLLPDSQMDRFTIRLSIGYPDPKGERRMVLSRQGRNPLDHLQQIVDQATLLSMQDYAAGIYIKEEIVDYIIRLITATRTHPAISRGASPRATLSVTAMAKAVAALKGRDYVLPADVQAAFATTVAHRLLLNSDLSAQSVSRDALLEEILKTTPAPRLR